MVDRQADSVLHGLRKLVEAQAAQLTDGQLLSRFTTHRDEAAFAVLLERYGRLVYGVCRNVLRHDHDAEDAFQATFLVLARRAGAIRTEQAIGSWLYRVAYRVATKARVAADRRRRQEYRAAKSPEERPGGDLAWRELQTMLDQELNRLPGKYRAPFVLCCVLGKSKSEAAADLGWKEGTVSSRLSHARQLLRSRLARRGVMLSVLLSGLAITGDGGAGAVPAALIAAVQEAVPRFLSGEAMTTAPAILARSVLRGMVLARVAFVGAVLAAIGLAGTAAAVAMHQPAETVAPVAFRPADDASPAAAVDPAGDRLQQMVVRGRVIGSDGKAVPGADIAILSDEIRPAGDRAFSLFDRRKVIFTGKADAQGKFHFVLPRLSLGKEHGRYCIASGAGHTVAWRLLQTLVEEPEFELRLKAGQRIRGRLVDAAGSPAAGVKLRVGGFSTLAQSRAIESLTEEITTAAWPAAKVTDADGNFVIDGMPPSSTVYLEVHDERFGPQWLDVPTGDNGSADAGTVKLAAPRVFEGTVIADDTQMPLAGATVVVQSHNAGSSVTQGRVTARTDGTGHFTARPYPGQSLSVTVGGAPGTPYLATFQSVKWPAAASRHEIEVRLQRGLLLRGRVVENGSGAPVAGARIQYRPMSGHNRNGDNGNLLVLWQWLDAGSDDNGQFELPVLPGRGHLLVRGPGHDWVPLEVGDDELIYGEKGGDRLYFPDALFRLSVKAGKEPPPVEVTLRRGVTLKGRVETADGKPVASGFLLSRTHLGSGWERNCEFLPVRDGRFEIPGCDPNPSGSEPYWFWDHKALQGAVVRLSANDQGTTVRLAPFGSASMRLVDPNGNVVRLPNTRVSLVVRPGRNPWDRSDKDKNKDSPVRLTQDATFQGLQVDAATGVVTVKALIPGASYVIETGQGRCSKPFSAPAGQNVRFPDVVVDPPPKNKRP